MKSWNFTSSNKYEELNSAVSYLPKCTCDYKSELPSHKSNTHWISPGRVMSDQRH